MKFMKQDLDQYESWRIMWQRRPHSKITESKVQRSEDGKAEWMIAQATAPGFRPERVMIVLPIPEPAKEEVAA